MKKVIALIYGIALFSTSLSLFAHPSVHTWHQVNAEVGTWKGSLHMINQGGYFVDVNYKNISDFNLVSKAPLTYGFMFDANANFDVAYTLTLTREDEKPSFQSKTCVFVITAKGPAIPDIRPLSYYGAKCNFKVVPGVGEDFFVG